MRSEDIYPWAATDVIATRFCPKCGNETARNRGFHRGSRWTMRFCKTDRDHIHFSCSRGIFELGCGYRFIALCKDDIVGKVTT